MNSDVILVSANEWLRLGHDGRAARVDPYPRLQRPTRVIIADENVQLGSLRFEGKTQFAHAIIERRLRQEGWSEGPNHVVIHHLEKNSQGGQAFYSAITLEAWQKLLQWVRREDDHCLIYPLGALLANVRRGRGRVLRLGRRFTMFYRVGHGFSFEDVYAAGRDADDMRLAVDTLGANVGSFLASAGVNAGLDVDWLAAPASPQAPAGESEFTAQLQQDVAGVSVHAVPARHFSDDTGEELVTSLPQGVKALGAMASANPTPDRLGWWSEAMAPAVIALIVALALGLGAAGFYAHNLATDKWTNATALMRQVDDQNEQIRQANFQDHSGEVAELAAFAERLNRGTRFAPTHVLKTLRSAIGEGVFIHRVYLESGRTGEYRLRVDGAARSDDDAMRKFLATLRSAGWQVAPLEPASNGPGSFSYRLEPVGNGV